MLGLFFLRFTGILRSQKNEEIRKQKIVILKKALEQDMEIAR